VKRLRGIASQPLYWMMYITDWLEMDSDLVVTKGIL
jgi:hypothetical protein